MGAINLLVCWYPQQWIRKLLLSTGSVFDTTSQEMGAINLQFSATVCFPRLLSSCIPSLTCPDKWVLSVDRCLQQCIRKSLLSTCSVFGTLPWQKVAINRSYSQQCMSRWLLSLCSLWVKQMGAIDRLFVCSVVLANECYQFATSPQPVLANGCYRNCGLQAAFLFCMWAISMCRLVVFIDGCF